MPSKTSGQTNPFADPAGLSSAAPLPPPKQQPILKHSPARPQQTARASNDLMAAVQDTVATRSPDHLPRSRPHRSQSSAPQALPARPSAAQRSISTDSRPTDKPRHKSKKPSGSAHADVIDRLDFSGVGPMFHHDGPFDACAPSRNRRRQNAPMFAWTGINPEDDQAYRAKEGFTGRNISAAKSPQAYYDDYEEAPKKIDAIAEAWGVHEPEPFEDFSAGGGDRPDSSAPPSRPGTYSKRDRQPRRDTADKPGRRPTLPPPQPIFGGDDALVGEDPAYPPSPSAGANLGRNKSLMQRIRKMRDNPNVPVSGTSANGNGNISPIESNDAAGNYQGRPTNRSQNQYPGRRGMSPASPDEFVYVDDVRSKDLPAPPDESSSPSAEGQLGYFDQNGSAGGVGRKPSLMRKMRGVVGRK